MIRLLLDSPALLGWTTAALIGQGLVILAMFSLARWLTRDGSALIRYRLATGTLALLVGSVPATLALAMNGLLPRLAGEISVGPSPAPMARLAFGISGIFPALAMIWALGFTLALVRLIVGAHRLGRLIAGATPAPAELSPSAQLLNRARVQQPPTVLVSSEIDGPFVAGWGSGVLVLPAGLSDQLGPAEHEAVVLHELMHLVRGDFVANLNLRLLAALLWFQPAIWIIVGELDRVREERCDDDVVRVGARPAVLASALVHLEELRLGAAPLALAGTGGVLTARVKRLLAPASQGAAHGGRFSIGLALVGATGIWSASVGSNWAATMTSRAVPVVTIRAEDPAGRFTLEMAGGVLRGMSVAGAAVPRSRLRQSGHTIQLLDERGGSALDIIMSSPGAIHWTPRSPTSP